MSNSPRSGFRGFNNYLALGVEGVEVVATGVDCPVAEVSCGVFWFEDSDAGIVI